MPVPEIDTSKCTGCGLCISVCDKNGLVLMQSRVVFIGGDKCNWCGMCEAVCESDAISCPYEIIVAENPG